MSSTGSACIHFLRVLTKNVPSKLNFAMVTNITKGEDDNVVESKRLRSSEIRVTEQLIRIDFIIPVYKNKNRQIVIGPLEPFMEPQN